MQTSGDPEPWHNPDEQVAVGG